ncbi:hypothetical protein [Rhizobium sp. Pop5]|uniref:hypothetical protein n=1 Tax=Rhizobium sp. Pop5 TaxID=1223565 RepID=UPI00028398FD|nr:hypothetical protein [Rhizobium sp. Pop5]EJZ17316.1 hypothetical protein RCCGEPOP_31409 [Rhizobium sp. Pop5]
MWFFVFTAVVYYLQHIPGIDAVLMILLASMWPIIAINLGFAGIAIEATSGTISRAWLCLPLLYFGGNLVLAGISHYQLWQLERRVEAANTVQSLPFPSGGALVVDSTQPGIGGLPEGLIGRYDIPVVYQISDAPKGAFSWKITAGSLCQTRYPKNGAVFGYLENHKLIHGMCTYRREEAPPRDAVKLAASAPIAHESFFLPYEEQRITITDGRDRSIELIYAQARPLTWFPMPFGGCFRGPGDAKSACIFEPLRVFVTPAIGPIGNTTDLVASTLNLTPSRASTRRQRIEAEAIPAVLRPALPF